MLLILILQQLIWILSMCPSTKYQRSARSSFGRVSDNRWSEWRESEWIKNNFTISLNHGQMLLLATVCASVLGKKKTWYITVAANYESYESHLCPDPLLFIHSHHTITDHVVHQVWGLDILLQFVAIAQQTAPRAFLQRHFCTTHQPCRILLYCKLEPIHRTSPKTIWPKKM